MQHRKRVRVYWTVAAVTLLIAVTAGLAGWHWYQYRTWKEVGVSGGKLRPAQAAYDVQHYALSIRVFPESESIAGSNRATVIATAPLEVFELQLDDRLEVAAVTVDGRDTGFTHADGLIRVPLESAWQPGERHAVRVEYAGTPLEAYRPPWMDGFVWAETPSGAPWIGTTSQGSGVDLWWPAKDHPSDEPDEGMSIRLTVPAGLVGLTNGRKTGETVNDDGSITSSWEVSYPINNYAVALSIAPYVPIETTYHGIHGEREETIIFWALPEHEEQARRLWKEQGAKILRVLGRRFGEYPFLRDKYWVAETPYLGMEHQTIVAYGDNFENNAYGFDGLLLHETAHEWWGNRITVRDWADFWIHEGITRYSEAVYVNDTLGRERYLDYMRDTCAQVSNAKPIVQGENLTEEQAYTGDIYNKGSCVMHALRWLLGDEAFFATLYDFQNDPRFAYKLVSTADFAGVAEAHHGADLDWFWDRYLYTAAAPRWKLTRTNEGANDRIRLDWIEPDTFPMPLPVRVDGAIRRVDMTGGAAQFSVPAGAEVRVDPEGWVLSAQDG